jgi:glucokinase
MNILFDIGATRSRVAISPDGSSLSDMLTIPTAAVYEKGVKDLGKIISKLAKKDKINNVCGGVAGVLDENKSQLLRSPNLAGWEKQPLKKSLAEITGAKVYLNNDAALEGLGEATMGAGRRKQIVAFLTVGTGIGGVKVEDGRICPNLWGYEPGHQIIDVNGKVGYWEEFAGGPAMEKVYGKKPEEIKDEAVWDQETRLLAIGIHNLILFWSPEILILGGGILKSIDLEKLKSYVREEMTMFPKIPEMVRSELGEKSGFYGAMAYLKAQNPGF